MIQISYKLTEPELYKGLTDISDSRFITKLFRIIGSVLLAVMVFITTSTLIKGTFSFTLSFAFPIFLGIYFFFLSDITARFQVPSLIKKKNRFTEQVVIKMYETGFRVKGETFANQFKWDNMNSIIETKDFFLLKDTEMTASVIPKRVLTEEETAEFKKIVSNITGPKIKMG